MPGTVCGYAWVRRVGNVWPDMVRCQNPDRLSVHALVSWWQLPRRHSRESVIELEPAIVPLALRSPGFVEAFWTYEPSNGKSVGFMLLRTAENARNLRDSIESHMEACDHSLVRLEMIRIQEIVAHLDAPLLQPDDEASKGSASSGAPDGPGSKS